VNAYSWLLTTVDMDNLDLLKAFKNNDNIAWSKIYKEYKPKLMLFIGRYVAIAADVDELSNDVFIKNIGKCNDVESFEHLKAWFRVCARNVINDYYRKKNSKKQISLQELKDIQEWINDDASAIFYMEEAEGVNRVATELKKQPDKRRLVCQYFCADYSAEEIAKKLKISVDTVYSHRKDARIALRDKLGKQLAKYKLLLSIGILLHAMIN
jgi:RNA polymerase sigma-70 factor, ECF subfamily